MKKLLLILLLPLQIFAANKPMGVFDLLSGKYAPLATNQYVNPAYTGTSTGSITQPWKTLSAVNQAALNPGDSVLFMRGQKYSGSMTISRSGSSGNPIVFGAYGTGNRPLFWGTGSTISYLFDATNDSWVTFTDLQFVDTTLSPTDRVPVSKIQRAIGTGTYITIKNCYFERCGLAAFFSSGGGFNTFDNCQVYNMRMIVSTIWIDTDGDGIRDSNEPQAEDDYGAGGIVMSSGNNTVSNSYFQSCWANSYDYTFDGGGIEIFGDGADNNTIIRNTFYDNNGEMECGANSGGTLTNNVVAYNKFINNGSCMLVQNSNLFTVNVANFQWYNNVIIQTSYPRGLSSAMFRFRSSGTPPGTGLLVFKNNIVMISQSIPFAKPNQLTGSILTRSNNIYALSGGSVLNYTINGTELLNPVGALWESTLGIPVSWNYTPAASSPAINFGTNVGISTDANGKPIQGAPDAGILERQAVVQSFRNYLKFVN